MLRRDRLDQLQSGRLFSSSRSRRSRYRSSIGQEDKLPRYVETVWAALTKFGLALGASISRLRFESDLEEVLPGVDMVQEQQPEVLRP